MCNKTRNGDQQREKERQKENVMVIYLYSEARFCHGSLSSLLGEIWRITMFKEKSSKHLSPTNHDKIFELVVISEKVWKEWGAKRQPT